MIRNLHWLLAILLATVAILWPVPMTAQGNGIRFVDLGYGDRTARGIDAVLDYYFPLPVGMQPAADGELILRFDHSPLLRPDRSTLSVALNGRSLSSIRLTPDNATGGVLSVPLPVAGFRGPGLFIQVQIHMRLTDDACEEVQNPALWTVARGDSELRLDLAPVTAGTLADLAALFAPLPLSAPATRLPPTLVVADSDEPASLAAAGVVAFAVGRWAALARQDAALQVANTLPAAEPAIVVALGALPAADWGKVRWNGTGYEVDGIALPVDHGLLALAPTTPPRLLVAGATPLALNRAAHALTVALPAATTLAVTQSPPAPLAPAWREGAASFAQLGVDRLQLTGAGEHQLDLSFERPPGWDLRVGGTLDIDLVAAAGLSAPTSWMAVTVNGNGLGAQRLQVDTPGSARYRFDLPADLLNSDLEGRPLRRLDLQLRLYLDLPNIGCEEVDTTAAWVTLEPTSAWRLPFDPAVADDLGRFPAMLVGESPARIVLPPQPTMAEVQAGLELAAAVGRWSADLTFPAPELVTADRADDDRRRPLAILGDTNRNPLAGALNAPTIEAFVYQPGRGPQVIARVLPSPWQAGGRVLHLAATDGAGLQLGARAFRERDLLEVLRGAQAQLTASPDTTIVPLTPPLVTPPQTLTPTIEVNLIERIPAWQIVGAILLIALTATAALVIWIRWIRRR